MASCHSVQIRSAQAMWSLREKGELGVGWELLLAWKAGSPKPLCLQLSSQGGGGARSREKAILNWRHHQDEPKVGCCSFCYPRALIPTLGGVEKWHKDVDRFAGWFWGEINPSKSPAWATAWMPSPPPLVVVGGITFYFERGAFELVISQCPIVPYLLQEDKTRVTRVVRVLRVDTNKI